MQILRFVTKTALAVHLAGGLVAAQNITYLPWPICANETATCAQANVTFAYYYGYPIYQYALAVQRTENPTANTLVHQRKVATAADTWLNKPNVDTLYSRAFLDVSASDLVINIPEIADRYWVWPFYDFYGNNIANLGILSSSPAGEYLVRFDSNNPGLHPSPDTRYQAYVNIPTPYGISATRILVAQNQTDVEAANRIQDELSITPVDRKSSRVAPPLNLTMFTDSELVPGSKNTLEEGVLKLLAHLSPYNEPVVAADRGWVSATLQGAGVSNGAFVQPENTNLTAASAAANSSVVQELAIPGYLTSLGNNWVLPDATYLGNFQSAYVTRYLIASTGYLALTREQTVYPQYVPSAVSPVIRSDRALRITFTSRPAMKTFGFWSLTVYDFQAYLVPNDLGRYAVGDRSNFTMMDGSSFSDGGEGPFQVLIQPSNMPPPANWTNNWLPSPADGKGLQLNLRFYGGKDVMSNGAYLYPLVEAIDPITL
ncbi:hypothetical protein CDEST_12939 [Colletotrichum destructivum]|uniref:DUF1254 domain-containing protein n=1 Tax=Colletotrichum destructivum TaxID=34406 RepID=A0AAX4IXD9_9PEZI|nr:hypothetical protein CDEST_12939 [Colletotrichum destructivum]